LQVEQQVSGWSELDAERDALADRVRRLQLGLGAFEREPV
jgi:hypothetical protein